MDRRGDQGNPAYILFLTTNRLADFDPAFHNRIHISIEYGRLGDEQRSNIWRQHLIRACKPNRNKKLRCDEAYALFGKIETNGRGIRNTTRTAFNYAHWMDHDLDDTHVVRVRENNLGGGSLPGLQDTFDRLQSLHDRLKSQTDGPSDEYASVCCFCPDFFSERRALAGAAWPSCRCYEPVCPQTVMARYSSSVSKYECPASVWATITAEADKAGGGGAGAAPTGGAGSGSGSGSKNGAAGAAAPLLFSVLVVVGAGALGVLL